SGIAGRIGARDVCAVLLPLIARSRSSVCYDGKRGTLTHCNGLIGWLSGNGNGNRWIGVLFGRAARASHTNARTNSNYEQSVNLKRSSGFPRHRSRGWLGTVLIRVLKIARKRNKRQ